MKKIYSNGPSLLPAASMKFLLEFFTCCGPRQPGSNRSAEDKGLLSAQAEPRRSMMGKREREIDDGGDGDQEWKPSLVSISEDDIFTEVSRTDHYRQTVAAERGRSLKRQATSSSPRRGSGSSSDSPFGRAPVSTVVRPTLMPSRSFMF